MPSVGNYGLRFHTISQTLGSSMSFFVPVSDMLDEDSARGYDTYVDDIVTPKGNAYNYTPGSRTKVWEMRFLDISTDTEEKLEHICSGWINKKQICILAFGTSVIGTVESMASMASAGQIYGTGYCRQVSRPRETVLDLWNFSLIWREYGSDQLFT